MDLNLDSFISSFMSSPPFAISIVLVLAVIFVNGWTDAPNAIATCVSTRAMKAKAAVIMAAVFNFLGVLIMTLITAKIAATIYNMVDFSQVAISPESNPAMIALCAALFAIVIWATAAWYFGIPTSESHALIAGISGSAIAMGGLGGINFSEWVKVLYGLGLSSVMGLGAGYLIVKLMEALFKKVTRSFANGFFNAGQIAGGAAMAFMHGAQDGQKFLGVMVLGMSLAQGQVETPVFSSVPLWMIVLVSLVMGVGTSVGGYKIIKTVGMDMVKLQKYQGFSADLAASGCLLLSTLTGIPVSTTHTKTTAIMGAGAARRFSAVNMGVVKEMFLAWVLTFPGCGLIGFVVTKLFVAFFV